CFQSREFPWTF
nr:immunoglobulin light chain junction region [Macaca mulatta]